MGALLALQGAARARLGPARHLRLLNPESRIFSLMPSNRRPGRTELEFMSQLQPASALSPSGQSALSDLEWRIVEMARTDGRRSLNPDGVWSRLARKIFKISMPRRLANDGLEALRRFSVRAWHWNFLRPSDVGVLIDRGYSRAAALRILEYIASRRGCMPSTQDNILTIDLGLEESVAPASPSSSSNSALPACQAPSLATRRGQHSHHRSWQPYPGEFRRHFASTRMTGVAQ